MSSDEKGAASGGRSRKLKILLALIAAPIVLGCCGIFVLQELAARVARRHGHESSAIGALKTITTLETVFREGDKDKNGVLDYGTLAQLRKAELIDELLGSGTKQGYLFQAGASVTTSEFLWFAVANPVTPGETGERYFCTNEAGVIFYTTSGSFALNTTDCKIPANGVSNSR